MVDGFSYFVIAAGISRCEFVLKSALLSSVFGAALGAAPSVQTMAPNIEITDEDDMDMFDDLGRESLEVSGFDGEDGDESTMNGELMPVDEVLRAEARDVEVACLMKSRFLGGSPSDPAPPQKKARASPPSTPSRVDATNPAKSDQVSGDCRQSDRSSGGSQKPSQ